MTIPSQTPLGVNVTSSLIQNIGFTINPVASSYMGTSKVNTSYTFGSVVKNTCLNLLTYSINDAFSRGVVTTGTYNSLISIGYNICPVLGNSKPPTYIASDPSGLWTTGNTPATTGYANTLNPNYPNNDQGQGQQASWLPYDTTNTNYAITQWGFIRNYALQAWNEFNYNGNPVSSIVEYKDFLNTLMTSYSFISSNNLSIEATKNSTSYLQGTYSNINDLTSSDITGINLATALFGQDLISAGKIIDLSMIDKFGLPSTLLQVIKTYNAMTQSLVLALISSGLLPEDIDNIATGNIIATPQQEQQIYGSFLVITGLDLVDVLVPLNCKTKNLDVLAELLDIKKIFPNSYQSMTVPVYNVIAGPTNSKTYYPIFENNAVSNRLCSPTITAQLPWPTFGFYLDGVVPNDIAVSSGAFAFSMQQIKNIKAVNFEKFAQVVSSIEVVNVGLDKINGSDVPVNVNLAQEGQNILSLGSGPNGKYTVSDFFGCMSGLPYSWKELESNILATQTTKLSNIYDQLYLATTWEYGTVSIQYTTNAGPTYTITGITLTDAGGGYGRGSAPAPIITISGGSGATATCTIGTDPSQAGSNNTGSYGRITSVTLTSAGITTGTIPTISIESPPIATLAVNADGSKSTSGVNTTSMYAGWPSMNTVVSAYITQANDEILAIKNNTNSKVSLLNQIYNIMGTQLMIEQRTRYKAFVPVPTPRDTFITQFPITMQTFTDMFSAFSTSTYPHMFAQTLEAIADLSTVGGQSIVALMRQERNAARLQQIGISLDTDIPVVDENMCPVLISNGTLPTAKTGIEVYGINGNDTYPTTLYTNPATLQQNNGNIISTKPMGYFDPNTNDYIKTTGSTSSNPIENILKVSKSITNNINLLGPMNNGTGPANVIDADNVDNVHFQTGTTNASTNVVTQIEPIIVLQTGPSVATGQGTKLDTGKAEFPGSLAGSQMINTISCTLNSAYTSSTLLPSTMDVQEAIDNVIRCNCDCWIE